jgi:16S rRNA (adenine1518-N6/adenine1519-N6)-dimethyltransferase
VTGFPDPRTLLSRYGLAAKKSWGQNFLIDTTVYDAIVAATVRARDEWVVEIGAGLGTLTMRLADAVPDGRVIAVEKDRDMVAVLARELANRPNVEVRDENALVFDYAAAAARAGGPVAVAGNLPYQIASPLLFQMIEARAHIRRAVVMLQKEMADRLVARPGTREYGALGVMLALHADVHPVVRARAGAFFPAPRVDSAVVRLEPLASPRVAVDPRRYGQTVHAAFGQRRKTLRNALRSLWPAEVVDAALAAAGVDGQRRGETLSVEEFARLADQLPGPPTHARAP